MNLKEIYLKYTEKFKEKIKEECIDNLFNIERERRITLKTEYTKSNQEPEALTSDIIKEMLRECGIDPLEIDREIILIGKDKGVKKIVKRKPDFYIEFDNKFIYFEVTGTNVRTVTPNHELWLRPDKVDYIQRHNLKAYACHILDNNYNLLRFIDMNNITERIIVHPIIRGTRETYIAIDPIDTISISEMKAILRIN